MPRGRTHAQGSHGARRPHRSAAQRLVLALGILTVLACLSVGGFIVFEEVKLAQIERKRVELAEAGDQEPQNWLIVGSDSRDVIAKNDPNAAVFTGGGEEPSGQRSDTIMIVRVDPKGERLDVLSLQRDLWLPIARTPGSERINTAYTFPDGPQRLVDTIKTNFNIDINHYAEINFAGFQGIVDAVGGVPMYFDHAMYDTNSGLQISKPGCVVLDGYQALAFARSRHLKWSDGLKWHDDETGDLGRIRRQQFFMRRMFDRAASKALSSPKTFDELVNVAIEYVGLDEEIEISKVVALAQRFGQFKGDSIKTHTLPATPWTTPGGAAVLRLDDANAQPILNTFRGIPEGDQAPGAVAFSIENGSGVTGQAAEAQKAFAAIGYRVVGTRDHGTNIDATEVRYAPGSQRVADQVARHLTAGARLVQDQTYATGTIVVVTGRDFTTVMKRPRTPSGTLPPEPAVDPAARATATAAPTSGVSTTTTTKRRGTTTTTAALAGGEPAEVGVVPGEPPPGVTCEAP